MTRWPANKPGRYCLSGSKFPRRVRGRRRAWSLLSLISRQSHEWPSIQDKKVGPHRFGRVSRVGV